MTMTCIHLDTCLAEYLTDHCNRPGELLLGVFVDGGHTFGEVKAALLSELAEAASAIDESEMPGFDYQEAVKAAKTIFADLHPMQLDRSLFDETLDLTEPDDRAEMVQAWFLFRW